MTGDAVANLIEAVATVIALAGLAVSFWFSWSGQRLQRQQADAAARAAVESNREAQAAAHRAAVSASLTIDQLTRIADAVSALGVQPGGAAPHVGAAAPGAGFESPVSPSVIGWRLESTGGDAYRLTNTGRAPAHDVWVGGAASLDGLRPLGGGVAEVGDGVGAPMLAPGAAVGFEARILPGTSDSTITVTWSASTRSAERSSWRYPLPAPAAPSVS